LESSQLTPRQVQEKRLELAAEMLELVMSDGEDLARKQRQTLKRLSEAVENLRRS
jgi:uncharacterized tellurite resistance protein B-like protein